MVEEKYNLIEIGKISTDIASVSIGGSEQLYMKHIAMLARQWKSEGFLEKFSEEELEEMFNGLQNGEIPEYIEDIELPIGDGTFTVFGHLKEEKAKGEAVTFNDIVSVELIIDKEHFGLD